MRQYWSGSNEQILTIIRLFYDTIGEVPTTTMFEKAKLGISNITVRKRFGTWANAMYLAIGKTREPKRAAIVKTGKTLPCMHCGKMIYKYLADLRKSPNKIFCSKSCATSWRNINEPAGLNRSKIESYIEPKLTEKYPSLVILFNDRSAIGLELDIFIPSLRLGIELNGQVHYEPIFGTQKFEKTQQRDKQKMIECYKQDIELAVINTCHKYFTPKTAMKFFDIIVDLIDSVIEKRQN